MATARAAPLFCLRCEVTRGPHAGEVFSHCTHGSSSAAAVAVATTGDGASLADNVSLTIGRQAKCWLRLRRDLEVSGVHAQLTVARTPHGRHVDEMKDRDEGRAIHVTLSDRKSTNGTKRNGQTLVPLTEYTLADQDLVLIGKSTLRFCTSSGCDCEPVAKEVAANDAEATTSQRQCVDVKAAEIPAVDADCPIAMDVEVASAAVATTTGLGGDAVDGKEDEDPFEPRLPTADGAVAQLLADNTTRSLSRRDVPPDASRQASAIPNGNAVVTTPSLPATCMVCGEWLRGWSLLEQHLHVNACLDGPLSSTMSTTTTAAAAVAPPVANTTSKRKRKRSHQQMLQGRRIRAGIEDDTMVMALALSKSLVDQEQEVDMEMALVSSELAAVEAQMQKLTKKRATLVKKLAKLEKRKAKVRKPVIRPPEEARVLLDLERALLALFPVVKAVNQSIESGNMPRRRRICWRWQVESDTDGVDKENEDVTRRMSSVENYLSQDSEWDRVSMWRRASQAIALPGADNPDLDTREEEEEAFYRTKLLDRFSRIRKENKDRGHQQQANGGEEEEDQQQDTTGHQGNPISLDDSTDDGGVHDVLVSDSNQSTQLCASMPYRHDGHDMIIDQVIPACVKHVFPNWRENLQFLESQSVADLKEALEEMRRARLERYAQAMEQGYVPPTQAGIDVVGHGEYTSSSVNAIEDEQRACVFFEQTMMRLMEKAQPDTRESTTMHDVVTEAMIQDFRREVSSQMLDHATSTEAPDVIMIADSSDDESMKMNENLDDKQEARVHHELEEQSSGSMSLEKQTAREEVIIIDGDASARNEPIHFEREGQTEILSQECRISDMNEEDTEHTGDNEASPTNASFHGGDTNMGSPTPKSVAPSDTSREPDAERGISMDSSAVSLSSTQALEGQLLSALKANPPLYEAVLLLRPLDMHHFYHYITQDVGIRCKKSVLVKFCDQNGITFKHSVSDTTGTLQPTTDPRASAADGTQ